MGATYKSLEEQKLEMCKVLGIIDADLELDSQILVNMLQNRIANNLNLRSAMEKILHNMSSINATVKHCYREANQVADDLAKYPSNHNIGLHFVGTAETTINTHIN
ncbi:hypothetical protein HAX54_020524 [Datura stramonium]|uniref:RNase H type-1 domain-containing protein n=1 Tax=Datura stramonium TaxID=4076 RepID=A0ABS8URD4_DATST|nr:hypothetical protein [Datura stramonium]